MTPILGIMASQISGHLSNTAYESIATYTVSGSAVSNITFGSIPSTYKHLQIRGMVRSDRVISAEGCHFYFNSDTTNSPGSGNYDSHTISGDGSTIGAGATVPTQGGTSPAIIPAANATADVFGGFILDILDYGDTNKYTTTRILTGFDANGSGLMRFNSGLWRNTAAITSIFMDSQGGGDFVDGTKIALYGIKG